MPINQLEKEDGNNICHVLGINAKGSRWENIQMYDA
jgi:hypothetical protein